MAAQKTKLYWVMGSGEPVNSKGFKSVVDARKLAIKKIAENRLHSVRTYGSLDIVKATEEPYRYAQNYLLVGEIKKSKVPGLYEYREYHSTMLGAKYVGTKMVDSNGQIVRRK